MNPVILNILQLMEENVQQSVFILKLFVPQLLLLNVISNVKLEKYSIEKKVVLPLLDVINI